MHCKHQERHHSKNWWDIAANCNISIKHFQNSVLVISSPFLPFFFPPSPLPHLSFPPFCSFLMSYLLFNWRVIVERKPCKSRLLQWPNTERKNQESRGECRGDRKDLLRLANFQKEISKIDSSKNSKWTNRRKTDQELWICWAESKFLGKSFPEGEINI